MTKTYNPCEKQAGLFCVGVLVVLSVFVPTWLTYHRSVNMPINHDDAAVCLEQFPLAGGEGTVLTYLFGLKNGHPHLMHRGYSVLSYALLGEVDFKWIILTCLAGVIVFSLWAGARHRSPGFLLLTTALVCSYSHNIFTWSSAAAGYSYACIFFFLTAIVASRPSWRTLPLLLLLMVACVFSFGNGIIAVPALLIGFGFQCWKDPDVSYRNAGPLALVLAVALGCYMSWVNGSGMISQTLPRILEDPLPFAWFVLEMSGSLARFLPLGVSVPVAARLFGVLLLVLPPLLILRTKEVKPMFPYMAMWLFIWGSSVAGALGRAYTSAGSGLAPRYEFNSVFLLFSVCGLIWVTPWKRSQFWIRGGVLTFVLSLIAFRTLDQSRYERARYMFRQEMADYLFSDVPERLNIEDPSSNTLGQLKHVYRINHIVEEAQQRGIYTPPPDLLEGAQILEEAASPERLTFLKQAWNTASQEGGPPKLVWVKRAPRGGLGVGFAADTGVFTGAARMTFLPMLSERDRAKAVAGRLWLLGRPLTVQPTAEVDMQTVWLTSPTRRAELILSPEVGTILIERFRPGPLPEQPQKPWAEIVWGMVSETNRSSL